MSYIINNTDTNENITTFAIEVTIDSSVAVVTSYVTADEADKTATKMSLMVPNGTVKLTSMCRIKAVYKNGKRLSLFDYKNFYSNLTKEEYKSTLIRDSRTAEFV